MNVERSCGFLDRQSGKYAHFDHGRGARVKFGEYAQCIVECDQFIRRTEAGDIDIVD